jgi:DNA-binding response OmpR family regulator
MLPGMDGVEVLRRLRVKSTVPVLMLTGRGEEPDRIVGLEMGADDYLPKTFSTRELLARLRAVIRRAQMPPSSSSQAGGSSGVVEMVEVGDLRIDPGARGARLGSQALTLTPVEFDVLLSLARGAGRVKTREQLILDAGDRDGDVFDRTIDVHISALRRKLGDDARSPKWIVTVRSAGYMMRKPGADTEWE